MFRLTKQDAPRIRVRSLDVIPLALSLPRSSPLSDITHAIFNCSSLDEWFQLHTLSPFTIRLLDFLISFYPRHQPQLTKRIPPLLAWNPSSLATIHQQPSPKLNLLLKRAQSHICLLQETNWSSVQYQHLLSSPFCEVLHSPATGEGSSGVATLLPRPLVASTHRIVAPGYILSVSTLISGLTFEILRRFNTLAACFWITCKATPAALMLFALLAETLTKRTRSSQLSSPISLMNFTTLFLVLPPPFAYLTAIPATWIFSFCKALTMFFSPFPLPSSSLIGPHFTQLVMQYIYVNFLAPLLFLLPR